jgi:hypothetical protein
VIAKKRQSEPERTRIDVVEGDLVGDPPPPRHDILLVAQTAGSALTVHDKISGTHQVAEAVHAGCE